ncbi:hypothetical protein [Nitrospirillum bahiense]|uniref:hypothetical protein n=1 Tax=Nitrospirillum amazonense TaxID=28077 RepID=UPI00164549CF|nr:hypothetical protein [Nitrospirillum amazonense]
MEDIEGMEFIGQNRPATDNDGFAIKIQAALPIGILFELEFALKGGVTVACIRHF